jgi:hypothetical protein
MSGTDDRAEVVGVFDAVEEDKEAGIGEDVVERSVVSGGGESDNTLMGKAFDHAVEGFAGFEADWDAAFTTDVDDLLETGSGGAFDEVDAVEWAGGTERLADGVDTGERKHGPEGDGSRAGAAN